MLYTSCYVTMSCATSLSLLSPVIGKIRLNGRGKGLRNILGDLMLSRSSRLHTLHCSLCPEVAGGVVGRAHPVLRHIPGPQNSETVDLN